MRDYRICSTPPPVGADPCVRPTTVGRTESAKEVEAKDGNGKEEANAKSAEYVVPTLGGHTGPPLQAGHVRRLRQAGHVRRVRQAGHVRRVRQADHVRRVRQSGHVRL